MNAFDLKGIRFRYRGQERDALSGVDFSAREGERVAVIGLTGAGKSTLLKCMNRLVPASNRGAFVGSVKILGEDIGGRRPAEMAGRVGIVFQDFESQLFSTTAELDAAFGPENLGLDAREIRARVDRALAAVGMEALRNRDPSTLSGGQKQRLAIATVLSLEPKILCLDEPVTDLDPEGRREVGALTAELCGQGLTVVLAEHEIDLIRSADRIVGLASGEKVMEADCSKALWDESMLEKMGVRPPDLVRVFTGLGLGKRPHDAAEAAEVLAKEGIRLRPGFAKELEERDAKARAKEGGILLQAESLVHSYPNGVRALDGLDLSVREGEFVALLGKNGSGKTTLVKHINGLLRPTEGSVRMCDKECVAEGTARLARQVGLVFQDPDHQIFAGRVIDEVAFGCRNFGMSDSEARDRSQKALSLVGLSGYDERDPFVLTKGERQRVALASVLAAEPPMIILDEPTTGLDYPAQRAVMELLAELNQEGRTVIVITHAMWVAAEYARRCVVMSDGKVLADGPTRAVLSDREAMNRAGLAPPEVTGLVAGASLVRVEELLEAASRGGG